MESLNEEVHSISIKAVANIQAPYFHWKVCMREPAFTAMKSARALTILNGADGITERVYF